MANCFDRGNRPTRSMHVIYRSLFIQTHRPGQGQFRIQSTESEIRIGDRRLLAPSVADRPGIGSGGLRSRVQNSSAIEPCQRTAACTDRVNIKHGNRYWNVQRCGTRW